MSKIRDDLFGAVYADGVVLHAGDTVPEGILVGVHLLDTAETVGMESVTVQESRTELETTATVALPDERVLPDALQEATTIPKRGRPRKAAVGE